MGAAVPTLPAASRAEALSVSEPPVGGSGVTLTVNVSVLDVTDGDIVRVSEFEKLPLEEKVMAATPTASLAETCTSMGLRGSRIAFCDGLAMRTCGATVS